MNGQATIPSAGHSLQPAFGYPSAQVLQIDRVFAHGSLMVQVKYQVKYARVTVGKRALVPEGSFCLSKRGFTIVLSTMDNSVKVL